MKIPLLNPYQKNSLRLTLVFVDKAMLQIERWLTSEDENEGLLYEIKDDLSAEEKSQLYSHIPRIRAIISELKEEFELEKQSDDKSRLVFGALPYLWQILMETTGRKMKGYGEVNPGLAEKLNPPINKLANLILKMTDIVEPAQRKPRIKSPKIP